MQLITFAAIVLHIAIATACITIHATYSGCVLDGITGGSDVVNAQMFDNGKKVCDSSAGVKWASDKSQFHIKCDQGYELTILKNLHQVSIAYFREKREEYSSC